MFYSQGKNTDFYIIYVNSFICYLFQFRLKMPFNNFIIKCIVDSVKYPAKQAILLLQTKDQIIISLYLYYVKLMNINKLSSKHTVMLSKY